MYLLAMFVVFTQFNVAAPSTRTCDEGMFGCESGGCVPNSWVCDGRNDCSDSSDETYAACQTFPCDGETNFRCDDGRCISKLWQCDGHPDCNDSSDEKACSEEQCTSGVTCDSGRCISHELRCDGIPQCRDGADEADCTSLLCARQGNTFRCDDSCIPDSWVCDGVVDCVDELDEQHCYFCSDPSLLWDRDNRMCVPRDPCQLANCQHTCQEGSCSCFPGYYLSQDGKRCLSQDAPPQFLVLAEHSNFVISLEEEEDQETGVFRDILKNSDIISLDYHYSLQRFVYADSQTQSILLTSFPTPSGKRTTLSEKRTTSLREIYYFGNSTLNDVVVDWVSDNVYWTNTTSHSLMISDIDGSTVVEMLKVERQPHHLTIDPLRSSLFWIGSIGVQSDIFTSDTTGTNYRPLFKGEFHPTCVTVDPVTGTVFWYDALFRAIFSSTLGSGEEDYEAYTTLLKNISHVENLKYYNGKLFWTAMEREEHLFLVYDVIDNAFIKTAELSEVASKITATPTLKISLFQKQLQHVFDTTLLGCRNNRGGCDDLCFAFPHDRMCGCGGDGKRMTHCAPANMRCEDNYCHQDSWCTVADDSESCRCGFGYSGDQCDLAECTDYCAALNTTCYLNTLSNLKHCCFSNGKCAGVPLKTGKPHVKPDPIHQHGASVSTIVIAGVSVAVLLLIALSVLGFKKWKQSRDRLRSNTLVDMYPMEPVKDDLRLEDDEPLLFN